MVELVVIVGGVEPVWLTMVVRLKIKYPGGQLKVALKQTELKS
jgi:hypothetical protein